jgi:hypothetical protein
MSRLERHAARNLQELAQGVRQYTQGADGRDTFPTAIEGLSMLRSDQANAILVPPSAMPKRNAFALHRNAGTVKSCMLWFGRD